MNDGTRQKALNALDGMAEIVRAERLIHGSYVDDSFDPARSTAVCQGHKYCAIGSLWAGAGVKVVLDAEYGDFPELPGVGEDDRADFMRRRPGLRAAYNALNEAARRYAEKNDIDLETLKCDTFWTKLPASPLEHLFEADDLNIGRTEMLKIIAAAKRRVKAAA